MRPVLAKKLVSAWLRRSPDRELEDSWDVRLRHETDCATPAGGRARVAAATGRHDRRRSEVTARKGELCESLRVGSKKPASANALKLHQCRCDAG